MINKFVYEPEMRWTYQIGKGQEGISHEAVNKTTQQSSVACGATHSVFSCIFLLFHVIGIVLTFCRFLV
jgi:hypothetical protein